LYRTTSTVKTDVSSIKFTVNIADWEKVADITMKSNEAYDATQTSVDYIGVYEKDDEKDGTYAYKVVKTNKAGVSASSSIVYVNINTAATATIGYTPSTNASFVDGTKAKSNVKITWDKNCQNYAAVLGTGDLDGYAVSYKDSETEQNIKYTLYRATLSSSLTEVVYEKVADAAAAAHDNLVTPKPKTYTWEAGSAVDHDANVVDYIDYTITDKDLDTGASYSYIVVASLDNANDELSNFVTVSGAN